MNLEFISKSKNSIVPSIRQIKEKAGIVWQKMHRILFFACLVMAAFAGGYIWWQNFYNGDWSPEKKQEYINSQNNSVVFNENDFQKVLAEIQARKDRSLIEHEPLKDIFE